MSAYNSECLNVFSGAYMQPPGEYKLRFFLLSLPGCRSSGSAAQSGAKPPAADLLTASHSSRESRALPDSHLEKQLIKRSLMGYHLWGALCACVCLLTDVWMHVYVCVYVMMVYICSYNVLIKSLQVKKEKKITSLTHYKVDVGCAANALKVILSQWNFNISILGLMLIF